MADKNRVRRRSLGFPRTLLNGQRVALRHLLPPIRSLADVGDKIYYRTMALANDATKRDYSLVGSSAQAALEAGLVEAAWFRPPIHPDRLAELHRRTNARAAVELMVWLGLLVGFGIGAVALWPSPIAVGLLAIYGALYGGAADSRWHEMGHNTAFRLRWINDAVYRVSSFMLWREATVWRWSHDRHHTDTIIVGRDLEIAIQRPTSRVQMLKAFSGIGSILFWRRIWLHAQGRRDPEVEEFLPESEWSAVRREARQYVAIQAAVVVACLALWSPLPLLLIGLPTVYGMWLMVFFGVTQHAGLQENVLDHRLNTRTVYMNPLFRFLYLNMNYHIEHHMFPTVPYYNLPALHAEIKDYLPEPLPNTAAAYREILRAIKTQRSDLSFEIERPVPDVADSRRQRISIAGNGPVATVTGEGSASVIRASTAGLAVGRVRRVDVGKSSYALYCLGSNDYVVTDGFCTHGGGGDSRSIEGPHLADGVVLDCAVVECPKHNGQFEIRTGAPLRRPVKDQLRVYDCVVVDGENAVEFRPTD